MRIGHSICPIYNRVVFANHSQITNFLFEQLSQRLMHTERTIQFDRTKRFLYLSDFPIVATIASTTLVTARGHGTAASTIGSNR